MRSGCACGLQHDTECNSVWQLSLHVAQSMHKHAQHSAEWYALKALHSVCTWYTHQGGATSVRFFFILSFSGALWLHLFCQGMLIICLLKYRLGTKTTLADKSPRSEAEAVSFFFVCRQGSRNPNGWPLCTKNASVLIPMQAKVCILAGSKFSPLFTQRQSSPKHTYPQHMHLFIPMYQ